MSVGKAWPRPAEGCVFAPGARLSFQRSRYRALAQTGDRFHICQRWVDSVQHYPGRKVLDLIQEALQGFKKVSSSIVPSMWDPPKAAPGEGGLDSIVERRPNVELGRRSSGAAVPAGGTIESHSGSLYGRSRARTGDPRLAKAVLSQLSYAPKSPLGDSTPPPSAPPVDPGMNPDADEAAAPPSS